MSDVITQEGLFSGSYRVTTRAYEGPDTSRICYLFSGQGGAREEVFRAAYERSGLVRERFDAADALAARIEAPPPTSFFRGTAEADRSCARTLALFTLQAALFDEVRRDGPRPHLVSGFSVGEFAALAAAGVASFDDLFEILAFREKRSPPDNSLGFLIAAAAPPDRVATALAGTGCSIANRNAPSQTVIAVRPEDREPVERRLRKGRIAFRTLEDVPQPFHSPWMRPVAVEVESFVREKRFEFAPPAFPLLSSVTGNLLTAEDVGVEPMARLLAAQVVEPVDFVSQIETAMSRGCVSFIEIGPHTVLSSFVKEIAGARFHKILTAESWLKDQHAPEPTRDTSEAAGSRFIELVKGVIARLTGYEIESISIEDRFQEDLGIDSIRKADIVFTILEESKRELTDDYDAASIRDVADAVVLVDGAAPRGTGGGGAAREGTFIRSVEVWSPAEPLTTGRLAPAAIRCASLAELIERRMTASQLFADAGAVVLIAGNDDFTSDGSSAGAVPADIERLESLLATFRQFARQGLDRDLDLFLVTKKNGHPLSIGLAAFFKSLRIEMPRLFFKHLRLHDDVDESAIRELASKESSDGQHVDVRYEDGTRSVPRLEPLPADPSAELEADSVIVAFGGARGTGFALLDALVDRGRLRILLAGRSSDEDQIVGAAIDRLARGGTEVAYLSCDARKRDDVRRALDVARNRWGTVDLVVNAVGADRVAPLAQQTAADLRTTLTSKLLPAVHILEAVRSGLATRSLHFSSITARYGNPGQTAYALANEAMNQMIVSMGRESGRLPGTAINFPPWDGVGMTASPHVYRELRRSGFALLRAQAAAQLVIADLTAQAHSVVDYQDPSDAFVYMAPLRDQRPLRPLLGEPTLDHRFERVLSRESDGWLRDHSIDGTSYLPAAAMAVMSLAAGDAGAAGSQRHIDGLEILSPLAVDGQPVTLSLEVRLVDGGLAVTGRTAVPHFRCRVGVTGSGVRADALRTVPPFEGKGERVSTSRLYRRGHFFHGRTFQTLHEAVMDPSGELTILVEERRLLPVFGSPGHDRLTQWLDAAFQALAFEAFRRRKVMALPVSVERITVAERLVRGDAQIRVAYGGGEDRVIRGDIDIATTTGQPLVRLDGVCLNVVEGGDRP